jgi:DNA mismatch repair protein MutS
MGSSADTPLMRQYLEVKERYPDCVVFFRVGDFYEMFFDDAVTVARAIDLTLTSRDKGSDNPTPMCGVPHHAAKHYLAKLIDKGFKVAICDQVEDPKFAKGIVKREVVRVVTPGVVLDEEQLDAKQGLYLAALHPDGPAIGLAYLDVTTGEFGCTELDAADAAALDDELARLAPRELLLPAGALPALRARLPIAFTDAPSGDPPSDAKLLEEALSATIQHLGLADWPRAAAAAAACVRYARATQPAGALPLSRLVPYRATDQLILDEASQRNLELFATIAEGKKHGSLLGLVDETRTAMGGRLLRRWIGAPLTDVARIRRRHDAVEWLVERAALRGELRAHLAEVYDLERLAGRATLGVASPRDLAALRRSLERLPAIAQAIASAEKRSLAVPELLALGGDLGGDVAADIAGTLVDDPPIQWKEGGIIRRGCSPELDELVDIAEGGKEKILAIEARERERTGISSLKVRYNRVFGYYLEITRSNLARVPADYVRKQTLANAERYVTPELAEYEAKVLGADERRIALEAELFGALRERVARHARRLQGLAERVAALDALAAFAEVAHTAGYVRPEVDAGAVIDITDGRHPVVERLAAPRESGGFVPNDVRLDPDDAQLLVVTGPNMAGKSTVMRQVALIALLGQAGSFVPARRARLGVVDRIFTRVGASDHLSRGDSTFMVEMRESASILRHATRRSLVILDEIGRGTSTYDGVSIAWAVAEHLHDRVGAKTLFATHYHELTALAQSRPRVRNVHVAVREVGGGIVFLHKLVDGGASRSYGIEVARLAGLPRTVIDRARAILATLEQSDRGTARAASPQLALFAPAPAPVPVPDAVPAPAPVPGAVVEKLRAVDPDDLTPRQAHQLLAELWALLKV